MLHPLRGVKPAGRSLLQSALLLCLLHNLPLINAGRNSRMIASCQLPIAYWNKRSTVD